MMTTNKRKKQYDLVVKELESKVFKPSGPEDINLPMTVVMVDWFLGGRTNPGYITNVDKDEVQEILDIIIQELMELHDSLRYDYNEDTKVLKFYLRFDKYKTVYKRVTGHDFE